MWLGLGSGSRARNDAARSAERHRRSQRIYRLSRSKGVYPLSRSEGRPFCSTHVNVQTLKSSRCNSDGILLALRLAPRLAPRLARRLFRTGRRGEEGGGGEEQGPQAGRYPHRVAKVRPLRQEEAWLRW